MVRTTGARAQAAASTRTAVLEAARGILSDPAVADWSMTAVADAAGVSRMTLYNQFGSRTALIEAVLDRVVARDRMDRLVAGTEHLDPAAALAAAVLTTCRFWHAERPLLRRLFATAYFQPAIGALLARREAWRRDQLVALLRRSGPVPDDRRCDALLALTGFPTYDRLGAAAEAPEVAARLLAALLPALLARDGEDGT